MRQVVVSMVLSECSSEDCENKVTMPFACSICDEFKCIDCMTDTIGSICIICGEGGLKPIMNPQFEGWEGGDLVDWFYKGFISTFFERSQRGESITVYCSFSETLDGFDIYIPKPIISWSEINGELERTKGWPLETRIEYFMRDYFNAFKFVSNISIEVSFDQVKSKVQHDDSWWKGLEISISRFEDKSGPLPWQDHGRVAVTLSKDKSEDN